MSDLTSVSRPSTGIHNTRNLIDPTSMRVLVFLSTHHRRLLTWLLAGYWVTLFVSTHMRMPNLGDLPRHSDKMMHFVAYAGLSFLLALRWSVARRLTWRHYGIIFAITAVYAVIDELLQTIPALNRTGDPLDALADCCGSAIGLGLFALSRAAFRRYASRF